MAVQLVTVSIRTWAFVDGDAGAVVIPDWAILGTETSNHAHVDTFLYHWLTARRLARGSTVMPHATSITLCSQHTKWPVKRCLNDIHRFQLGKHLGVVLGELFAECSGKFPGGEREFSRGKFMGNVWRETVMGMFWGIFREAKLSTEEIADLWF